MDLFEENLNQELEKGAPLAYRMRPRTLDGFVGQAELVGPGTVLRQAIEDDALSSLILYGPPGVGKTSLAKVIANMTSAYWEELSAVTAGISDVRKVIKRARDRLGGSGQPTLLFVDEIHRFNKVQQDALLPAVEAKQIILIGATTENPFFEVVSPLVSRARVYALQPLTADELRSIAERALSDEERGLGKFGAELAKESLEHLLKVAGGDARVVLNTIEMAVLATKPDKNGKRRVALKVVEEVLQKRALVYDQQGDAHYDTVSAFIKSMRGSDPDASLYWLARMLYGGEDPKFIARRMIIAASEDVGLADSRALEVAVAAARAVEFVGLPEGRLNLAHAALYLATAPKSNSVIKGIDRALNDVERDEAPPVPKHLRDSHYRGAKELGHGKGYQYPHDYQDHYVSQDYLPPGWSAKRYYEPSDCGDEMRTAEGLSGWNPDTPAAGPKSSGKRSARGQDDDPDAERDRDI